jgi:hypothetical protein
MLAIMVQCGISCSYVAPFLLDNAHTISDCIFFAIAHKTALDFSSVSLQILPPMIRRTSADAHLQPTLGHL